ncbi:MAG: SufB/SufD family protein [Acidimicrobiales bacterium]
MRSRFRRRSTPPVMQSTSTAFSIDASAALGGPSWLRLRRTEAAERVQSTPMPSEAEEIWRYSGIDRFSLEPFAPLAPDAAVGADIDAVRAMAQALGRRSALVVTCGGALLSVEQDPDDPVVRVAGHGAEASADVDHSSPWVGEILGPVSDDEGDALALLHTAFVRDLVVVHIASGRILRDPVVIVHVVPGSEPSPSALFPHTVVRLDDNAEAVVVELVVAAPGSADESALVLPRTDLVVGDGARLRFAAVQQAGPGDTSVALQRSTVGRDASFESFSVGLGGSYARLRTDCTLAGQGGSSALLAAYLGTGTQIHDFRTLQDHAAPRTTSELLFTGAVADTARSVYSGMIRIRHGARRSDARQTNHNLVLSQGAHADSVPNLDIDENDVRCSHASTVGPIDEDQRYYLESRGIEPAVAERLIVLGFFSSMAARAPIAGVGAAVERAVGERLKGRLGDG